MVTAARKLATSLPSTSIVFYLLSKSGGHLETEIWCISRKAANEDILIQQGNRKINWRLDSDAYISSATRGGTYSTQGRCKILVGKSDEKAQWIWAKIV
jgi:hypothetical protein